MIYVYDHDKVMQFWTEHLNFTVSEDTEEMGMRVVKLLPQDQAETAIVLEDNSSFCLILW